MPLRVLHLGSGGLTLARHGAATWQGSHQLAVESEAGQPSLSGGGCGWISSAGPRSGTGRIGVRVAGPSCAAARR
jgi:hypothetical protein